MIVSINQSIIQWRQTSYLLLSVAYTQRANEAKAKAKHGIPYPISKQLWVVSGLMALIIPCIPRSDVAWQPPGQLLKCVLPYSIALSTPSL